MMHSLSFGVMKDIIDFRDNLTWDNFWPFIEPEISMIHNTSTHDSLSILSGEFNERIKAVFLLNNF